MGHGGNKTQRVDIIDSYDPRITGRAAQKGTLFRYIPASGDPVLLIKKDDGFSTEWEPVGGSGASPVTVARVRDANANVDINSAPADIDGVTLDADDIVLLTNQTAPEENGVYTFNGENIAMTRASGWNTSLDFVPGRQVYIDQGDTNAEQLWANADYVPNLDTDPVTFINVSASAGMATDFSNAQPAANNIDMQNNSILNVGGPTNGGDATNKTYVDNEVGAKMSQDFSDAQPAANEIDMNGNLIKNVADPVDQQDAATKAYVDGAIAPPTGNPNTVAFYDGSGNLSAGTDFINVGAGLDGAMRIARTSGVATAVIGDNGTLVQGNANNRGSLIASTSGCFAGGYAEGLGFGFDPFCAINASAQGSFAYGHVTQAGSVIGASARGAIAFGYGENFGQIASAGLGTLVHGHSTNGGALIATGAGAHSSGSTTSSGSVVASGAASQARGYVVTNAVIESSGIASHASGFAQGDGGSTPSECLIKSIGDGSTATGYILGGFASTISATGLGSFANGCIIPPVFAGALPPGLITASGRGSHAEGFCIQGEIESAEDGSYAGGYVEGNGSIIASGVASMAFGRVDSAASSIEASGIASLAFGSSNNVSADYGAAIGIGLYSTAWGCFVVGSFNPNTVYTPGAYVATDPAFIVGGGADDANRFDAFRVDKDGSVTESGSNRVPIRILTGDSVASARTDRKFVLNSADPAASLTLPPGEEGLTFRAGVASANTAVWSLIPDGADIVDANLSGLFGGTTVEMTFTSGTWYGA